MFQETLTLRELRNIISDIKDAATCPICLELARPPACLCNNGHLICSACKANLDICPTCRTTFSAMNPVDLNNILNTMPRNCENVSQGCDYVSGQSSQSDHRYWCKFRVVPCKMDSCEWIGTYEEIITHLQTDHSDDITIENHTMSHPYQSEKSCHFVYPILVKDNLLWEHFKIDTDKNKLLIMIQCCPSSSEQLNHIYTYELKGFKDSNIGYKYTQKVCREGDNVEDVFEKEICMAVPLSIVDLFFVNEFGMLSCNFNITKYEQDTPPSFLDNT